MGFYTIWHHINSSLLLMLKFRSFTLSILTHLGTTVYAIRKKKMIHTQCNTLGMSLRHSRIFSYLIVVEVTMTTINFSPRHQSHSDVSKTCHDKCRLPIGSFLTIANVPFCLWCDKGNCSVEQTGNQLPEVLDKNLETNTGTQFSFIKFQILH